GRPRIAGEVGAAHGARRLQIREDGAKRRVERGVKPSARPSAAAQGGRKDRDRRGGDGPRHGSPAAPQRGAGMGAAIGAFGQCLVLVLCARQSLTVRREWPCVLHCRRPH
ncbi:MAG: hypothetical protein K2X49_07625, partial [Acetobacteraceae bacterium]|nr:hypothetical protein [Acetobacteraceae bacterium]